MLTLTWAPQARDCALRPMRIGIDATAVSSAEGTGIQSYALNLTRALLALDKRNTYVVYCRQNIPEPFLAYKDKAEFRVCPLSKRKLCEQVWLSSASRRDHLDILHCICSLPLYYPHRAVLTVLGLSWRIRPEVFTPALRRYWILTAERTMKRATRLLAISNWTKDMVTSRLGIPGDRIDVVHLGVRSDVFSTRSQPGEAERIRRKYGLAEKFILHVGALIPVKNLPKLIEAYRRLITLEPFSDYQLVLAGGRGWAAESLYALVAEVGLSDRVVFPGFVEAEDLPALYRAAKLFVFPSLYEGFGIPLLESFASGTPVLSSNASCLPEVGGDAALFVDSTDEAALADAMAKALSDSALRANLTSKGIERAQLFTWEETARKTLEVYERACRVPA